jgi:hypothetical protein
LVSRIKGNGVLEDRVMRKIFGDRREDETAGWRKSA